MSVVSVDAPSSRASKHEVEEDEAVENRRVTPVIGREQTFWGMAHEVGNGHLTGENECHWSGIKTEQDQSAPGDLQHACETKHREKRRLRG